MPEVMTTALAETDRGAVSDEAVDHVKRLASKATVVAIGPGLSAEDERTRKFVKSVVEDQNHTHRYRCGCAELPRTLAGRVAGVRSTPADSNSSRRRDEATDRDH